MTLQEIRVFYNYFTTTADKVGLVLYILIEEDSVTQIMQADIDDLTSIDLKSTYIDSLAKIITDDTLELMPISQGDNRKDVWYEYDLEDIPVRLKNMSEVINKRDFPIFDFGDGDFSNIKGFIITIGNDTKTIALYKNLTHLHMIRGSSVFGIRYANNRFERVRDDIIKLSSNIDFFQIDDSIFIINIKTLERGFNFETIVRKQALKNIDIIEKLNLVEDIAPLKEMAKELSFAKKITKIREDSPVINLPISQIVNFVKNHPPLKNRIRTNKDESRIILDTKVSQKLFLKLINDDLLTSELTLRYYDILAKDSIKIDEDA
jgi:hypothetical protein